MISAVICHPDSFDFPLFRKNLPNLQRHVDEVLICFTKHGNHSLRDWLRANIENVRFFDEETASGYGGDWRNKATNLMLDNARGDYILSLEQDFFIKDYDDFFRKIKLAMDKHDLISFVENQRFHPAFFLFPKTKAMDTLHDFSVLGQHKDHFWLFSKQIKMLTNHTTLDNLDLIQGRDWLHLGGLTDNYFAPKPYYRLPDFYRYNKVCMGVPCSPYWQSEMQRCDGEPGESISNIESFL